MTPERVAFYAEQAWPAGYEETSIRAIERAITKAVNEALDEAAVSAEIGTNPLGIMTVADAIRALKLPEE